MEIRQLRYFVRIADLGSFSRAAGALHVAQPALSQQMGQLERELGEQLFTRRSTGVELTQPGHVFYRHAQRVLKQLAQIAPAVKAGSANPVGTVAVGLPQSTAAQFAMPLLAAVRERLPGVALELYDEISGDLLRGVNAGRLDLAVLVSDGDAALLKAVPLLDETLYLVSAPALAPRGRSVAVKRLAQLPLTLPGPGQGVRDLVDAAVRAQGGAPSEPAIVANSMSIMRQAVLDGLAHSVLPWGAVANELAAGRLKAAPLSPALARRAWLCTAHDADPPPAALAVADLLNAIVREHVQSRRWPGTALPS
jgi:LysR family nitrogen assimilation transcriptional regulator